ncbi:hypothetical protein GCM10010873_32460 [Cypionkella aquatica]|uniref:Arc-like DNA binding domain-containing protein n=1 Tax=Cypionkella aquatica TaxID=1756042 RepID=A0AA37U2J0_9RHOB|nr:Arc family DNA-binding protein [Cypionkella aquatica]GLS88272.1 hypothetical protein GCM10010873_32460 [Cypionkella aquatica]
MSDSTSRESDKFMLRLPDGMRERIKAYADSNRRSMNAEIIARITESLDADLAIAVVRVDFFASAEDLWLAADRLSNMAQMARDRAIVVAMEAEADNIERMKGPSE